MNPTQPTPHPTTRVVGGLWRKYTVKTSFGATFQSKSHPTRLNLVKSTNIKPKQSDSKNQITTKYLDACNNRLTEVNTADMCYNYCQHAPIAQLDRAPGFGPGGRGFESLSVYHEEAVP